MGPNSGGGAFVEMNKKGFFFTVLALFLVLMLLSAVNLKQRSSMLNKNLAEEVRVNTMNSFLDDFERDAERAVYITSFRAVNSVINYITSNGRFIGDFNSAFEEAFFYGTINNEMQGIMENSTFYDWIGRVKRIAKTYSINLSVEPYYLQVKQSNPWSLNVMVNMSVDAVDMGGIASWHYNTSINTSVSIIGLEDPLYAVAALGRIFNTIRRWPYQHFVSGTNTSYLKEFINNSYYIADSNAPDFIMRLEGNFSASQNGIESIFYLPKFSEQGLTILEKSAVDYVYLSNVSIPLYIINNTYEDWLRLDEGHLALYEVENLTK